MSSTTAGHESFSYTTFTVGTASTIILTKEDTSDLSELVIANLSEETIWIKIGDNPVAVVNNCFNIYQKERAIWNMPHIPKGVDVAAVSSGGSNTIMVQRAW